MKSICLALALLLGSAAAVAAAAGDEKARLLLEAMLERIK
jgi:hypothetical protein